MRDAASGQWVSRVGHLWRGLVCGGGGCDGVVVWAMAMASATVAAFIAVPESGTSMGHKRALPPIGSSLFQLPGGRWRADVV